VIEPPQASPNGASEGTEAVAVETETLERRRRCITARTPIEAAPEAIWAVLTDYEALAEFIPNLSASNRLERPDGGIRLEQIGAQRALGLDIRARVVLDLEEDFPDQIRFALVEGDFQTTIYSFFHQQRSRDAGLASITREVGQNQDEYDDAYMQRDGLLIVTKDVVKQRLQECVESPGEVEHILSSYYREMPTV